HPVQPVLAGRAFGPGLLSPGQGSASCTNLGWREFSSVPHSIVFAGQFVVSLEDTWQPLQSGCGPAVSRKCGGCNPERCVGSAPSYPRWLCTVLRWRAIPAFLVAGPTKGIGRHYLICRRWRSVAKALPLCARSSPTSASPLPAV